MANQATLLQAIIRYADPATLDSFANRNQADSKSQAHFEFSLGLSVQSILRRAALPYYDFSSDPTFLVQKMSRKLRARLQSGELVASGFIKSVDSKSERADIAPAEWVFLKPDYHDSSGAADGLKIVQILVRVAASLRCSAIRTMTIGVSTGRSTCTTTSSYPALGLNYRRSDRRATHSRKKRIRR